MNADQIDGKNYEYYHQVKEIIEKHTLKLHVERKISQFDLQAGGPYIERQLLEDLSAMISDKLLNSREAVKRDVRNDFAEMRFSVDVVIIPEDQISSFCGDIMRLMLDREFLDNMKSLADDFVASKEDTE